AEQLARRDRADRHDHLDRGLLRVHRAAGLEPLQAGDALRGFPAGEPLSRRGAEGARALDRGDPHRDQARERLGAGARRAAGGAARDLPDGLGAADALADRHGGRAWAVRRPEPVAEPVHCESQHRPAVEHVHVRVEARVEDDVLPALAPGDRDREDDRRPRRSRGREGRGRDRLLAREPGNLRGVPVMGAALLDPGFELTLRPMRYPRFYEMYRAAIKNTWTVEEIDFQIDLGHLRERMTPAERHLIERLVAFFATGDSIVSNNLVLSLYRHINAPEARMYLSRQLFEEALHIQFYLTLLDNYVPDHARRAEAFAAIETIPSIRRKAEFCKRWIDSVQGLECIETEADRRAFVLNLTCFACCIEGLFFFAAFAYVYFSR